MKGKFVYFFDEGKKEMKELLGGKGANLAEMTNLGIPVPPGFTITTEACRQFYKKDKEFPEGLDKEIEKNLSRLEEETGAKLGDPKNPLLVSVRSGAAVSMPGMMDTVLNLGLNKDTIKGLAEKTGNERLAWDSYRRFIQMFGDVVMSIEHSKFESILEEVKEEKGVEYDTELDINDLKKIVKKYKELFKKETGEDFPEDPEEQLKRAVDAVFSSWNNERAISYRKMNNITELLGTAVNVQAMVFGNMGEDSGTGVCFSRNPSTGENKFYGEYLMNAQGEDVVAGIRTPKPIGKLKEQKPEVYEELVEIKNKLEEHYKDMQDMEFTIQEGKLYLLQTRTGKRTAKAAVRIAVDMVNEELISKKKAISRIEPEQLDQLLHKQLDPVAKEESEDIAEGLPASPGAAVGEVYFDAGKVKEMAEEGKDVILVRKETSPEDIEGMNVSKGILTSRGGMTSHAAVIARGIGKCCIAGCSDIEINEEDGLFLTEEGIEVKEGDVISLDGNKGKVILGKVRVIDPQMDEYFEKLMEWSDEFRELGVRTNADTPEDSEVAIKFGAEGIGLCRTEHMFFQEDRIRKMREMILADNTEQRRDALFELFKMQKKDFKAIFRVAKGKTVTIRLLDPPLHEFLPNEEEEIKELAKVKNVSVEKLKERIDSLKELNPMLGHRGCRLGISYPEIVRMQSKAALSAAVDLKEEGIKVTPEIMIPLVSEPKEVEHLRERIVKRIDKFFENAGKKADYKIGTMIEIPRAAIRAGDIAKNADFFSFGTNDLTQLTFGFSRDDVGAFLNKYIEGGILENDPFKVLDRNGVGELIKMAVKKGKKANKDLKLGICGEHGGEPSSIEFCHKVGLDYVSCSPYRVPIARLAAAQAALE